MIIVTWALILAALPLLVASLVICIEAAASLLPVRGNTGPNKCRGSLAVLVPAHNEAQGIAETLRSIRAGLKSGDRILVVADNCTDATAALAAAAGAEVISRDQPDLPGKGYALDFGVHHLRQSPPDIVVVVDADCKPTLEAIDTLATFTNTTGRPAQAHYVLSASQHTSLGRSKVARVAWTFKTFVRPLGLSRLGLPCPLMGTGMAFPWDVISRVPLGSGNVVEDIALGLDCAALGFAPLYFPAATFTSSFPASELGQSTQRTRWESGHLNMIRRAIPQHLAQAIQQRNRDLFALGLDAAVPPLAFLALAMAIMLILGAAGLALGASAYPLMITLLSICLGLAALVMAWPKAAAGTITLLEVGLIPAYAFGKLYLYCRILAGEQAKWIRTKRD